MGSRGCLFTTLATAYHDYFENIYRMVKQNFPQANFAFEVMRGSYNISAAKPITIKMYENLIKKAEEYKQSIIINKKKWIAILVLRLFLA